MTNQRYQIAIVNHANFSEYYLKDNLNPDTAELLSQEWLFGEKPTKKPSKTQPNMVPSMEELVRRFVRGQHVDVFEPVFNEDFPPGIEQMDFAERYEMADKMREFQDETRKRIQERRAKSVPAEPAPAPAPAPPPAPAPAPPNPPNPKPQG